MPLEWSLTFDLSFLFALSQSLARSLSFSWSLCLSFSLFFFLSSFFRFRGGEGDWLVDSDAGRAGVFEALPELFFFVWTGLQLSEALSAPLSDSDADSF